MFIQRERETSYNFDYFLNLLLRKVSSTLSLLIADYILEKKILEVQWLMFYFSNSKRCQSRSCTICQGLALAWILWSWNREFLLNTIPAATNNQFKVHSEKLKKKKVANPGTIGKNQRRLYRDNMVSGNGIQIRGQGGIEWGFWNDCPEYQNRTLNELSSFYHSSSWSSLRKLRG